MELFDRFNQDIEIVVKQVDRPGRFTAKFRPWLAPVRLGRKAS